MKPSATTKPRKFDPYQLLKAIQAAPNDSYERYEWFLRYVGSIATSGAGPAASAIELHEKSHPLIQRTVALRSDLTGAVLQALAFAAGRLDVLHRDFDGCQIGALPPESLDALGRLRMAEGDLPGAADCYTRIESTIRAPYYPASRLASISYCMGDLARANACYARFLSYMSPPSAPRHVLEAAGTFAAAVRAGAESYAANEDYWADKEHVRGLIDSYELELAGGWPYRTVARQINNAATAMVRAAADADRELAAAVNYGSFCGAVDLERAEAMPALRWIGHDREALAIEYSNERFRRDNLIFLSGDYDDALAQAMEASGGRVALFHARATCEMLPAKVARVYRIAAERGIEWIVGAEYVGVDALTGRYFDPDGPGGGASSAVTRQVANHDYQKLLTDAGYAVTAIKKEPIVAFYGPLELPDMAFVTATVIQSFAARRVR